MSSIASSPSTVSLGALLQRRLPSQIVEFGSQTFAVISEVNARYPLDIQAGDDLCSVILAHQMEAQVDLRYHTRRSKDLPVVNTEHAQVELAGREPLLKSLHVHPV